MNTIIIGDDEGSAARLVEMILSPASPMRCDIMAICTPEVAPEKIRSLRPQLVFLDIEHALTGDLDNIVGSDPTAVELIIAAKTDQYALPALKRGAVDYLIKPVRHDELKAALHKVSARKNGTAQQLEMLMTYFKPAKPKVRRVALTASDHLVFVETDDIIYCESDSNYTSFYLTNGERIVISKTLKDVEELLEGDDFFRIHASYLINMKHVSRFTRGDGGYVVMRNNQNITVSRKKKDEFFERFSKL